MRDTHESMPSNEHDKTVLVFCTCRHSNGLKVIVQESSKPAAWKIDMLIWSNCASVPKLQETQCDRQCDRASKQRCPCLFVVFPLSSLKWEQPFEEFLPRKKINCVHHAGFSEDKIRELTRLPTHIYTHSYKDDVFCRCGCLPNGFFFYQIMNASKQGQNAAMKAALARSSQAIHLDHPFIFRGRFP